VVENGDISPDSIAGAIGIRPELAATVARGVNELRALQGSSETLTKVMASVNELQAWIDAWNRKDRAQWQPSARRSHASIKA
ncbi:hypothetical protein, partial [Ferrimicrobium acidiphilum]